MERKTEEVDYEKIFSEINEDKIQSWEVKPNSINFNRKFFPTTSCLSGNSKSKTA